MNETGSSIPAPPETTEVLYGNDKIIKATLQTFAFVKERMVGSLDSAGPAIHIDYEPIWAGLVQLKEKGVKIRVVTEVTSSNITYCKKLLNVCELRHLDGVRTNFAIADGREALLHGVSQETSPLSQAIITSVKGMVEAQEYLFENLWKNAIPAQYKIKEIEEGIKPTFTEILRDAHGIQKLVFDLVSSTKEEILMIFFQHTAIGNTFLVEESVHKIMELLKDVVIQNKVRVRILTSNYIREQIERLIEKQKIRTSSKEIGRQKEETEDDVGGLVRLGKQGKIEIHLIDAIEEQQHIHLQTKVSILIVDSKVSLVEEPNTNNKEENNSTGDLVLATYSNSEATLLAYISIFETLWAQTELKQKSLC